MKTRFYLFSLTAVAALTACSQPAIDNVVESESVLVADSQPTLSGFDCIAEFKEQLYLLGRGENYPNFIADDITEELLKQDPESKLVSAMCKSEVELGIKVIDIKVDGTEQQSLDYLEASFPLELVVFNGEENWILDVKLQYQVNGLVSLDTPQLTKNFNVIESYDTERNVLKKLPVVYVDSDDSE